MQELTIHWFPQPKQLRFLRACGLAHPFDGDRPTKPEAEMIGYGGAAGGGKTDGMLAAGIIFALTYPGSRIGYFRRRYTELQGPGGAIMRSQELLTPALGTRAYNQQHRRWTFPNGSILQFCHCENEDDVFKYQSQQFDVLLFDEATQMTWFQVSYLQSRLRSVRGYPTFCGLATNPGNVGHVWFRDFFVKAGPYEQPNVVEIEPGRHKVTMFIPSKLEDNRILEKADPTYRRRLEALPENDRRRLLEGDWDVFDGQFFSEWRYELHVVEPFVLPETWTRYRVMDYGLDMTAVYWVAIDTLGNAYFYKELYESNLIIREAAQKIREMTLPNESIRATYAPPDLWNRRQDTGRSAADIFAENGVYLTKADNNRIDGWLAMKEWLKPETVRDEQTGETIQKTRLKIFSNCRNLIRCIPLLQHDENNPNDVATDPHEITHAPDACRYFCIMRTKASKEAEAEKSPIQRHKEMLAKRNRRLARFRNIGGIQHAAFAWEQS